MPSLNYGEELKSALNVAMLKKDEMQKVAADTNKTSFGYIVIIVAAVLGLVGQQVFLTWLKPSLGMSVVSAVVQIVGTILGIYVLSFVAKSLFKGQAKHDEFFRVAAYGVVVSWLSLLPQIGILAAIWGLVVTFVVLTTVHKLTAGAAVGTIIVTAVVMLLLSMLLAPIYAALGFSSFGGSFEFGGNSWFGNEAGYDFETPEGVGSMKFDQDGGAMKIKTDQGESMMEFSEGKMKIKNEAGETVEFEMPMMPTN